MVPTAERERAGGEKAVLVGVQLPGTSDEEMAESLEELEALARTAGAEPEATVTQKLDAYNPATVLGRGKVEDVNRATRASQADLVIFDNELTVTQQDRLSDALDARVVDRTALILDIFALHAHTGEGKTQVELAQLSYLLPRIRGRGVELSRLGGGIGTRGPGETKLEVDRRRIRRRMHKLEGDLSQMVAVRATQRKRRERAGLPGVCLVGYTNSGKSTLLNRLTGAGVVVEDQLFSTLDSTSRRLDMADGPSIVISDTVGFIRKLPHELVAAFRSTLEVVMDADLLVHVIDASRRETLQDRVRSVEEVLRDLGAEGISRINALNKTDLVERGELDRLLRVYEGSVTISAAGGAGIGSLLLAIGESLAATVLTLRVPAGRGEVLSRLYRDGAVLRTELDGETMMVTVRLPGDAKERYREFMGDGAKTTH
ncbi:MAG: GTPase HflX [Actinobacteria bacterium]|nr:GTPase HflX [Actinomycetota bacterium]MBU1942882.1 GTPase HflX [Actinomycetota bacterium]MBU2687614.1 GTPase HflX [Actinomycetota bacterium]